MTFWKDYPSVSVIGIGLESERPATPESVGHAWWSKDTEQFYLVNNLLEWVEIGAGSGNASLIPEPLAVEYIVPAGYQQVAGPITIESGGSLVVNGYLYFIYPP